MYSTAHHEGGKLPLFDRVISTAFPNHDIRSSFASPPSNAFKSAAFQLGQL